MIQSITVDLIPNGKMPMLHASQYDDGRQVRINLTENRQAYTLTGNEVLSLAVRKADNTLVTMDIANTYGGKSYVEFDTTEQMTAVSGLNFGELTITNNGTKVGSLNFYLACEPSPEAGGLRSRSEIMNLNRQIDDHIDEVLPEQVADIAPAIVEEVAPAVVREVAPSVVREVAGPIVEELVPIAVGNNYYNKVQTDEKIAGLIDDTQASASKAYSSNKVDSLVGDVQNEINNINNGYSWTNPTATWTTGYIDNEGNVKTNLDTNKYSSAILLGNTKKVAVNHSRNNANITTIAFYNKDDIRSANLVSRIYNVTANSLYDVPSGAKYVVFTLPNAVANNETVFLFSETLESINNDINELKSGYYLENLSVAFTNGYVNNEGDVRTGGTTLVSDELSVDGIEAFALNFTVSNINYKYIAFYGETPNSKNVLVQGLSSVTSGSFVQVPANAKYVRFTIPTAYTRDYVVTKKISETYNIKSALDKRTNNEEIGVIFGDSIIYGLGVVPQGGQVPYENAVAEVNRILGGTVYNAGLGGATLCRPVTPNGNNFCELIDALCGDTTWDTIDARVEASITEDSKYKGYRTTIGALKTLDFSTVDYVVIAYGTNDWTSDYNVGDDTSTSDHTIAGALKYCLGKLFTLNPALKIYIVCPSYRYNQSTLVDSNTETHNGKNLREYAQELENFVKLYSLPCLNLYTDGCINYYNRPQFLIDGVHRTLSGYKLLGQQIAKLVMSK